MIILGISGGFSYRLLDMSAAILYNGKIIAAAEEERFNRIKHSPHKIPISAIKFVLQKAMITLDQVDILAYNNNTYHNFETDLKSYLKYKFNSLPKKFVAVNHHLSHAASAYWGSGYQQTAILSYDYSGDAICTALYHGHNNQLELLEQIETKSGNSLGRFYATFTQYLGFKQLSDEYKVMGMSAYGNRHDLFDLNPIINIQSTNYQINPMIYHHQPTTSLDQPQFNEDYLSQHLIPLRHELDPITCDHYKLAISIQVAFEQATMSLIRKLKQLTKSDHLCLAGGCALNCVANGIIHQSALFSQLYIPPVASDAGGAIGAAYWVAAQHGEQVEPLTTAYLGPDYTNSDIKQWIDLIKIEAVEIDNLVNDAAQSIAQGKLVGWFQGRSEYGPRALGARSILANPSDRTMRDKINRYVKYRETFRPFAPSVTLNQANQYFDNFTNSPFMNIVFKVLQPDLLPAVTHIDGTARVQSVANDTDHQLYYNLLQALHQEIGQPIVLNTSFNINGQPIVNTPHEAIYTFYSSGLDILYLNNFKLTKPIQ